MNEKASFDSHLEEHPKDWGFRLVFADWLEEQGDSFCQTQRWMTEQEVDISYDEFITFTWDFNDLPNHINSHREQPDGYRSRDEAESDLHNALVKARVIPGELIEIQFTPLHRIIE